MKIDKVKILLSISMIATSLVLATNESLALTVANQSRYTDTYVSPCFTYSNGARFCNGNAGTYFYDKETQKFWMYLTRINRYREIIETKWVEYNPTTKKINWNAQLQPSIAFAAMEAVNKTIAGQEGLISVHAPAKTVAQMKAAEQKAIQKAKQAEEQAKKAEQDRVAAELKAKENAKLKHQQALLKAKEAGTLPSCKKLYWKTRLDPLNIPTESNPDPLKEIEGTEYTYCQMKDGSTSMLQFQEGTDSVTGAKYRKLKLMDFTGKRKYYSWN